MSGHSLSKLFSSSSGFSDHSGLSLTKLFSSSSSTDHAGQQVSQSFTFAQSPDGPKTTIIQREGWQGSAIPVYSTTTSRSNIQVSRLVGWTPTLQGTLIGDATFHSLSLALTPTADLRLHGQSMPLRQSSLSSGWNLTCPRSGKLRWKKAGAMGSALELSDEAGAKLARFQLSGALLRADGRKLDLLVPCDDLFLDLVVLTGLAAARMHEKDAKETETAMEVVSALAGS